MTKKRREATQRIWPLSQNMYPCFCVRLCLCWIENDLLSFLYTGSRITSYRYFMWPRSRWVWKTKREREREKHAYRYMVCILGDFGLCMLLCLCICVCNQRNVFECNKERKREYLNVFVFQCYNGRCVSLFTCMVCDWRVSVFIELQA